MCLGEGWDAMMKSDEGDQRVKQAGARDANHFSLQKRCIVSDKITMVEKRDVYPICTALTLEHHWQTPL